MLAVTLAGCGWHLRGAYDLPPGMSPVYIEGASNTGQLVRYIKRDLRAAGIEIAESPSPDAAVFSLRTRSGRRTLSVGPDGKAREYEVYYVARFTVRSSASGVVVPEQEVTLTRDFIFDPLDALAVNEEQELLEQSMERDLARLVIERVSAAADHRGRQTDVTGRPEQGASDAASEEGDRKGSLSPVKGPSGGAAPFDSQ